MKRQRPPMPPLSVRVEVAERQFKWFHDGLEWMIYQDQLELEGAFGVLSLTKRLKWLLSRIFEDGEGVAPHALDHDPALVLRPYNSRINDVASRYEPHAHDPAALVYRAKADHQQKTTGRKPGAERTITVKGSDVGLAAKFRRLERDKPKRKAKITSRPFGKQKRSFGGKQSGRKL